MEPYNPEKSWLEFKFNKEQAKEQLKQTIPGLRALMYMHDNPESSALETLDLAAEDFVPFYSAIKYGADPSDFAKEAMLLGLIRHVGGPSKSELIKEIKNNPNREWYNSNQDLYYKDNNGNIVNYDSPDYTPDMNNIRKYNSYQDVLDDIDNTQEAILAAKPLRDKWRELQDPNRAYKAADDFKYDTGITPDYVDVSGAWPDVIAKEPGTTDYYVYKNYADYGQPAIWKREWKVDYNSIKSNKDRYMDYNDAVARGKIDKANKDLKRDIQMFNLDERWYSDPEFKHMKYDDPYEWIEGD